MENTDKFQRPSETPVQPLRPPSYDPETAQADADAEAAARAAQVSQPDPPRGRDPVAQPQTAPVVDAQPATETPKPKPALGELPAAQAARQPQQRPVAVTRVAAKGKPVAASPGTQPGGGPKRAPQPIAAQPAAAPPATAATAPVATGPVTKKVEPGEAGIEQKSQPAAPEAIAQPVAAASVAAPAAAATTPVVTTETAPPPATAEPTGQPSSLRADEVRLLQTRGLVKIYDGRAVVKEVDIHVRPTEIVGLLGPNGAGKTTTFYMIVGLVPPNGGRVFFNDEDVTDDPMYRRARKGMGYLPQEESIFRKLTVEQNIMAVMETLNISRSERRDRCHALMKQFGIEHIGKSLALTCSGGEKRRLTIARSLVTQPKLLMLDEPFSGVDPIAVSEIQDIIVGLREAGLAILITDHNVRETLNIVDRACLICEGKVLREGTRDFLINDPISRELYLGDRFSM